MKSYKKITLLFLFAILVIQTLSAQDNYLQDAQNCFINGNYDCAVRNYRNYQLIGTENVDTLISKAENCQKIRMLADAYFEDENLEKAKEHYLKLLVLNPRDPVAIERTEEKEVITDTIPDYKIEMVRVEGGIFVMGCTPDQGDCSNNEKPAHKVTLNDFYIGKYEVTQQQWTAIMGNNPSRFKGEDNPVETVSWYEVQEFIRILNKKTGKKYRLPTEAEWEYAARGGSQSKGYKYSGSNNPEDVAWFSGNSTKKTYPVGTKQANELDIYDMSGNVWEWCNDLYDSNYYPISPKRNPSGSDLGSKRVYRGGSWNLGDLFCRSAYRNSYSPDYKHASIGFRLVLNIEEKETAKNKE